MTLTDRTVEAPEHWPSAAEIKRAATDDVLVILPDRVKDSDGFVTAFFRTDAQALRVRAVEAAVATVMLAPEGAELAGYSEFTDDWVLPVVVAVLGASLSIPAGVVANLIDDRIEGARQQNVAPPIVLYREAVIVENDVRLREIEGPAEEVARLLRERGATATLPPLVDSPPSERFPPLTDRFPLDDP